MIYNFPRSYFQLHVYMYHLLYRVINIFHAIPVQRSQILYRPEFFSGLIFTTAQVVFLPAGRSLSYSRLSPQFKYMTFIYPQSFIHHFTGLFGLLVQLVERCTGIAVQIPYRPEFFLRPYFHYCSSSVPYCEDCFHIHNYFPLELCYKYTTFT